MSAAPLAVQRGEIHFTLSGFIGQKLFSNPPIAWFVPFGAELLNVDCSTKLQPLTGLFINFSLHFVGQKHLGGSTLNY